MDSEARGTTASPPPPALRAADVAAFVHGIPAGAVRALGGLDPGSLRVLLDDTAPPTGRRALFVPLMRPGPATALVEQIADHLAAMAQRLWPVWFGTIDFADCGRDGLGRAAAAARIGAAAGRTPGLLRPWAERAVRLALGGHPPRVDGTPKGTEIAQLARVSGPDGLVLVVDAAPPGLADDRLVRALEWIAETAGLAVLTLFPELPASRPPLDRLLHDARMLVPGTAAGAGGADTALSTREPARDAPASWLAPVCGMPHPLSEIEQRIAALLAADRELSSLFRFNQPIRTVRGSSFRVDLVWTDGRLVVELDGDDHALRRKFIDDRHRDYELMLSGFTVLRLANAEIEQDFGRAIEKIRDLVGLCRSRRGTEGTT